MDYTKTNNCNELNKNDIKNKVKLIGNCNSLRDHGGKKFIDLRDRYGKTQIVFDPDITKNFDEVQSFKREFLIQIEGVVRKRPQGQTNSKILTGEIEVLVEEFRVINSSDMLPFGIDDEKDKEANEELRLEYRYLDLRRDSMKNTIINKSKFLKKVRDIFEEEEFIDIETPIITNSSPEGARDFIVPSRKHKGKFFALPQAPQIFKQLLMVGGFEKYFQITKCFRDEDLRKDRQYEFIQIDCEVAFWTQKEIFNFIEKIIRKSFKEVYNIDIEEVLTIPYKKSIELYGCDKPDLRINLPTLKDFTNELKDCGFSVFSNNIKNGGIVKALNFKNGSKHLTRGDIDKLIVFTQKELGAKGLAWFKVENNKLESSISKFFNENDLKIIKDKLEAENEDLLFFISDSMNNTNDILDGLRRHLAYTYNCYEKDKHMLCFIDEFPMFNYNNENKKLEFEHNPFTMCHDKDENFILNCDKNNNEDVKKLLSLTSDCYDMVYNGFEICSGARRISNPKLQEKVFEICNFSKKEIEDNFLYLTRAYKFGAPPHRGFALGVDRIIMLLENKNSIREVIPFPRNKHGFCPLTNSPSALNDENQLKDLGIKINIDKKENQ